MEGIIIRRDKSNDKARRLHDIVNMHNPQAFLNDYHSYDEIVGWLRYLKTQYDGIITVENIGVTHSGRTMYGVKV